MGHVLIADDVAISRDTLARVLRDAGHRITTAASGEEALSRARGDRPDLAVLDLNMPRMNGLETAAALKTAFPGALLPVLIVSGRALTPQELSEVLLLAEDFLRKPFTPTEVCARVQVWLRTRRLFESRGSGNSGPLPALGPPPAAEPAGRPRPQAALLSRIDEEWRRARREPFALLLCETLGDSAAGEGLLQLARVAEKVLRQGDSVDTVGQPGGARLAVLLPRTPPAGALHAAERLRDAVRQQVTAAMAMGMALVPGPDVADPQDLYRVAEAALLRACTAGPFSLCLHQHRGYHLVRSP